MSTSSATASPPSWTGEPTIQDVLTVKDILARYIQLPAELIDIIIDFAEYWPHTTSFPHIQYKVGLTYRDEENILITRSLPLGYPDSSATNPYPLPAQDYIRDVNISYPPLETAQFDSEARTQWLVNTWTALAFPGRSYEHPCRKVVFRIKSHDQGWGGEEQGTFRSSFTWFDVGLEKVQGVGVQNVPGTSTGRRVTYDTPSTRGMEGKGRYPVQPSSPESWNNLGFHLGTIQPSFCDPLPPGRINNPGYFLPLDHPFLPHNKTLQRNRTAVYRSSQYEIVWRWDDDINPQSAEADELEQNGRGRATGNGEFVRNLGVGDIVTVWARARFPGWANHVEKVEIDVYWAM
ncbi:hypothetical protein GQ43DRAFT_390081 [Delitschia confertaspora ATCC 74209]|uniref:Uncharacterized protein n=1 Tax=Delitschia confertaspora ATCC 74209 TaxID=1513339 RepID=A0A9P4JQM3_9PLEO|nr:hypothetical protein GQ43DRAFT_390081 [Delitschia confertaspora ATCC 74209]